MIPRSSLFRALAVAAASPSSSPRPAASAADAPLRIIVFGAHPDDCDLDAGGTAALWAAKGHAVKFVSLTNGDAGHQTRGRRRARETAAGGGAGGRAPASASPSTRCSTTTTASSSRRSPCASR